MSSKFPVVKGVMVAIALLAGASGVASGNPMGGGWNAADPVGLSVRQYQALSSESPVWQMPAQAASSSLASVNPAPSARQRQSVALSERDYQALSSESPVWQLHGRPDAVRVATNAD